jgi:hypothetical protein
MRRTPHTVRSAAALAVTAAALITAATAIASGSVTDHSSGFFKVAPGKTRMLSISYPDALKYGNATYSGHYVVQAVKSKLKAPDLAKVTILYAGSALGGSSYEVRAHNANAAGSAAVRIKMTATTVEGLPHN